MTTRRIACLGFVAGAGFAAGVTVFMVVRAAFTITRAGRWYQLKHL